MHKKLKTLERVKSLYAEIEYEGEGVCLYNNKNNATFINEDMYPFFGDEIEVISHNEDVIYSYRQKNYSWLYCEEWFDNDLFSDEEFMI